MDKNKHCDILLFCFQKGKNAMELIEKFIRISGQDALSMSITKY